MSGSSGELKPLCEQQEQEAWSQPRPWAPWYNGWWSHVYLKSTWAGDSNKDDGNDKDGTKDGRPQKSFSEIHHINPCASYTDFLR